jgi:ribosomal protein S18 acetylase RimI-like enzyme
MNLNIEIIKAELTDLPQVANLFDQYRVFYKQTSDLELATQFISERLTFKDSIIHIAWINNEAVGFTQLYPSFSSVSAKRIWILNDLFVLESARQLGVAKQLMDSARQLAIETDAKGLALKTAKTNKAAQALYESLDYQQDTEFLSYFLGINN